MKHQLAAKLEEIRKVRNLDPKSWVDKKCELLNNYMTKNGLKACVVNVSGGIDSALTILLCKAASEKPGSPIKKVKGIIQPIHSTDAIMKRAIDFVKAKNLDHVLIDQSEVFNLLSSTVEKAYGYEAPPFAKGQLKSYMRTPVAYFSAQLLSATGTPAIVVGTGNYDEDGYLFYFCKPGDGTNDVQLIHDLHKSEVGKVAEYIGVTKEIIEAPPSADLWPGQTDEGELGFGYDFIELYTEMVEKKAELEKWVKTLDAEDKAQWDEISSKIEKIHTRNKHKESWPINLDIMCPNGIKYVE